MTSILSLFQKKKKRVTAPRVIAFILAALLPAFDIFTGIISCFLESRILDFANLLYYFLLPAISLFVLACVIFSHKGRFVKLLLVILSLALFVVLWLYIVFIGGFRDLESYEGQELEAHYAQTQKDFPMLSPLSELGNPEKLEYYNYHYIVAVFFETETNTLICKYNADDYQAQKALLDERYIFQSKPVHDHGYVWEPRTEIDGYEFRILSIEEKEEDNAEYYYNPNYPKAMVLIATNDETHEIVYMTFRDSELDYIDSLENFIRKDCGWKHIQKARK